MKKLPEPRREIKVKLPESKRGRIILSAVAAIAGVSLLILITSHTGGNNSASNPASGGNTTPTFWCYGTDSYGNVGVQAGSSNSLANCEQFISQLAEVPHSGTVPGGVSAQGIACTVIATSPATNPWSVVATDNTPSNLCDLLMQDGYAEP